MPTSYVYLAGELLLETTVGNGGSIEVALSDNNGLDWKQIGKFTASGEQPLDLSPYVLRRYDYRLRFILQGTGTGLQRLKLRHDIQHSQRALPALDQGNNTISFSAGRHEGAVTVECGSDPAQQSKQLTAADYHIQFD